MNTPNPEVAAILRGARELIATEDRWTKGAFRRDANGQMCAPGEAVCWCAEAAVHKMAEDNWILAAEAIRLLEQIVSQEPFCSWQDAPGRTHAEVLAALDRAIAAAEGNQP